MEVYFYTHKIEVENFAKGFFNVSVKIIHIPSNKDYTTKFKIEIERKVVQSNSLKYILSITPSTKLKTALNFKENFILQIKELQWYKLQTLINLFPSEHKYCNSVSSHSNSKNQLFLVKVQY